MRAFKVMISCVAFAAVTSMATAQDKPPPRPAGDQPAGERPQRGPGQGPGGGQRQALSPEKAKAAQELEAAGVAKRLGLDETKTKAVVKAYIDARESYTKAQEKLMSEMRDKMQDADDRQAAMANMRKAMEEMNKTEREKLEKTLKSSLSDEQATKAVASLGTFNRQWDTMADTIAGFKLEAAKQQTALEAVEDYVVALGKAPRPAADGDREAARTAMQEARTKLTDAMKKVLSEEQMKKFEETTRGPGRGAGGPGGPGGGGGRRDDGGR